MIVADADFIGGFALWVGDDGLLRHTYSLLGVETYKQVATEKLPAGEICVKMLFEADEPKPGSGGKVDAVHRRQGGGRGPDAEDGADDVHQLLRHGHRPRQRRGRDLDYEPKAPYAFTGKVKKVTFDLSPHAHSDELALHQHHVLQAVAHGAAG